MKKIFYERKNTSYARKKLFYSRKNMFNARKKVFHARKRVFTHGKENYHPMLCPDSILMLLSRDDATASDKNLFSSSVRNAKTG
jgi:hypothetical protein